MDTELCVLWYSMDYEEALSSGEFNEQGMIHACTWNVLDPHTCAQCRKLGDPWKQRQRRDRWRSASIPASPRWTPPYLTSISSPLGTTRADCRKWPTTSHTSSTTTALSGLYKPEGYTWSFSIRTRLARKSFDASYMQMIPYIYMQGRVVSYKAFDTWGDGSSSAALVAHLSSIPAGRIVCFAVLVSSN